MRVYDSHLLLLKVFQQIHQPPDLLCVVWQRVDQYWHHDISIVYRRAGFGWLPGAGIFGPNVCCPELYSSYREARVQLRLTNNHSFLPADVLWTLSMAVNVYLTFYHQFEARDLRKLEPVYLLLCYGIPFVPGFTFLFVKNREGDRIYGPAISWCWISHEWDILRLAAFYAPMW